MASIESRDLKLSEVFQAFYAVPNYQREYVWHDDQVQRLLDDIRLEQTSSENADYFIGSIVTSPSVGGATLDLIDGQQRITTLFVLFCALRDRLEALGDNETATIRKVIADASVDESGRERTQARLDAQYEDAGDVFERLVGGNPPARGIGTRSMQNIATAYFTCLDFLEKEFGRDVSAIRKFYGYISNKVKLIRIETDSVARALKIFETINDRGVALDAMDLLKNLLFMKADAEQYASLQKDWKDLSDTIYASKEKPLRFLRYYMFATYGLKGKREDELYDWLSSKDGPSEISDDPLKFVKQLKQGFDAYDNFINGRDAGGSERPYTESLAILAGKATRQHLILLLAGRSLHDDLFEALCRDAEQLLFTYFVTKQITREFENLFPDWAGQLRKVTNLDEYRAFSEGTFQRRRAELAAPFHREFGTLDWGQMKTGHRRYAVAKLTQAVDLAAYNPDKDRWLSRYTDASNHVEHILPQKYTEAVAEEFGDGADSPAQIWSIGNLALVEKSINASLSNDSYSYKRGIYPRSQFLLTRCISGKQDVGRTTNTAIDKAIAAFEPADVWNVQAIARRSGALDRLAAEVWDVPMSGEQSSATQTIEVPVTP
jgi:hypothetical protein